MDGRPLDTELVSLEDQKAERQRVIDRSIEDRITQHQTWNTGFHDLTWRPLTPPLESFDNGFQTVIVTNDALPSPPPSTEDMDVDGVVSKPTDPNAELNESTIITPHPMRYHTNPLVSPAPSPQPSPQSNQNPILAFRTRTGRSNRQWLDRRLTSASKAESAAQLVDLDPHVADRMKYDSDNDEDDGEGGFAKDLLYPVDHFSDESMRVRAAVAVGGPRRESVVQDSRRIGAAMNGVPAGRQMS